MKKAFYIFLLLFLFSGMPVINYEIPIRPVVVFISEDYNSQRKRNRFIKHRRYRVRVII
jgi:hypothetical protein